MDAYAKFAPRSDEPSDVLVLRVKAQILFPHTGILHALWKFQYQWHIARKCNRCALRIDDDDPQFHLQKKHVNRATDNEGQKKNRRTARWTFHTTHLLAARYHRLNAHEGYIDYVYMVDYCCGDSLSSSKKNSATSFPSTNVRFRDIRFTAISRNSATTKTYLQLAVEREQRRSALANDILVRRLGRSTKQQQQGERQRRRTSIERRDGTNDTPAVDCYFFWRDDKWWSEQALRHPGLTNFIASSSSPLSKRRSLSLSFSGGGRVVRLLNILTRALLVHRRVKSVEQAVALLARASSSHVDFLQKLYVEPTASSLFAAYLSTTFMHHKQQHGLNTKHAAGKGDDGNEISAESQRYASRTKFDQKIYLDMCSSCDKKDIFEIMLKMQMAEHRESMPCRCEICDRLTGMANAWRYYDCIDHLWLRLEFNRRMYNSVSLLLSQHSASVRIVFFSYKNEFHEREKFIANFVNYYAFYENNEQPVSEQDLHGALREKISIIFVFAVVNWKLIVNAIDSRKMHNSISLNQQSIFKSLDNTLYAIFSENSINRMAKETEQRVLDINAPYINRGFGSLPNCGVNAFTTTVG